MSELRGIYTVERADGSVELTDVPPADGASQPWRARQESVPSATASSPDAAGAQPYDPELAETLIKEAQKRIPKLHDYFEYLRYLRHHSPLRFERVMNELRREDPVAWLKLQKHPQFRPLHQTALGLKAGTNWIEAGMNAATGRYGGGIERWAENTLKAMMKRDRWDADVLGTKASTLPSKTPKYSNSRLGQHMKVEDARLAAAGKAAASELEAARAGLRAARATAIVRPGGLALDWLVQMLNPEVAKYGGTALLRAKLDKLRLHGVLDEEQYLEAHALLSAGQFDAMRRLMDDAISAYLQGRR